VLPEGLFQVWEVFEFSGPRVSTGLTYEIHLNHLHSPSTGGGKSLRGLVVILALTLARPFLAWLAKNLGHNKGKRQVSVERNSEDCIYLDVIVQV
jgi:hypothetical protein